MATVVPNEGEEWMSQKLFDGVSGTPFIIAVGTGSTSPTESDTSLANEVYRANDNDSNCTVQPTSNNGEFVGKITISGGTEVAAGTDVTEFGLYPSDGSTLLYREVRTAVTIQSGDRKTFEFTVTLTDN